MPAQAKKQQRGANPATRKVNVGGMPPVAARVEAKPEPSDGPGPVESKVQVEQLMKEACGNQEMVEEFICRICLVHVVGCNPKLTRCSHLFCGDCMSKWFAAHQGNQTWAQRAQAAGSHRVAPCPVCKQQLQEGKDLFPVSAGSGSQSAMLWRMLCSFKVACANHPSVRPDGQCSWVGEYGSYQEHARACKNSCISEDPVPPRPHASAVPAAVPAAEPASAIDLPVQERGAGSPAAKPRLPSEDLSTCGSADTFETQDSDGAVSDQGPAGPTSPATAAPSEAEPSDGPQDAPVQGSGAYLPSAAGQEQSAGADEADRPAAACGEAVTMGDLVQSIQKLVALQAAQRTGTENPPFRAHRPQPERSTARAQPSDEAGTMKVVAPFSAAIPSQLSLDGGDLVEVIEQHSSGWTYGRKVCEGQLEASSAAAGWFPDWVVSP